MLICMAIAGGDADVDAIFLFFTLWHIFKLLFYTPSPGRALGFFWAG